ncbi:MAG: tRNA (N(6)-L-threonylcarbamoyladenosine(37)-C(2))-methylthiotransferase MtaB [Lachnospiraceae bacterium]|nr:tRNA (N(6)-L-threonylcarbamoyladenosine(37)-C(2))-methylthiotransferase MtaB [Lachnospiraceae bacterium]
MKNIAFHNLGCKVNSYETDVMQQILQEKGYNIVPFDQTADIYIVNTCTVTNIADRKSRQMLHRAKQLNPDAVVVAVGCYVQTGLETIEKDGSIDLVVGNNRKKEIAHILEEFLREREQRSGSREFSSVAQTEPPQGTAVQAEPPQGIAVQAEPPQGTAVQAEPPQGTAVQTEPPQGTAVQAEPSHGTVMSGKSSWSTVLQEKTLHGAALADINHPLEYEEMTLKQTAEHTRAYIKIQDGCNQFCSYCAIPYARGRVRSRKQENVIKEIRGLVEAGFKEVVLTGIHISSYGIDFEGKKAYSGESGLIGLIERIQEIDGLERIRLGSLEPRIVTEETAERLSVLSKLCPHFHLSLQSGCDAVLRRMNRHYTIGEYYTGVEHLRKYFDNPAVTTDIIVGFPGETEEEFTETKAFLEKVRFYEMHIFKYSRREGTAAASMPGQVPEQTKTQRSNILLAMEKQQSAEFRRRYIGGEAEVLLEEEKEIGGEIYLIGHTKDYVKAAVRKGRGLRTNETVKMRFREMLTDEILLCDHSLAECFHTEESQ